MTYYMCSIFSEGRRLPKEALRIPHVREEREVPGFDPKGLEEANQTGYEMVATARQIQEEYMHVKQRAAVLTEEKSVVRIVSGVHTHTHYDLYKLLNYISSSSHPHLF